VDEQGRTIGLLTLRKFRRVPSDQWPSSRVRDHMVPLSDQVVVPPDAPMDQAMAKLEGGEAGRVLAAEDGAVVGIITSSDLPGGCAARGCSTGERWTAESAERRREGIEVTRFAPVLRFCG
jgi:CBS domain containing-hemolysin-like protein